MTRPSARRRERLAAARVTSEGAYAVLHPGSRPAPDIETPAAPGDDAVDAALAGLDERREAV